MPLKPSEKKIETRKQGYCFYFSFLILIVFDLEPKQMEYGTNMFVGLNSGYRCKAVDIFRCSNFSIGLAMGWASLWWGQYIQISFMMLALAWPGPNSAWFWCPSTIQSIALHWATLGCNFLTHLHRRNTAILSVLALMLWAGRV